MLDKWIERDGLRAVRPSAQQLVVLGLRRLAFGYFVFRNSFADLGLHGVV